MRAFVWFLAVFGSVALLFFVTIFGFGVFGAGKITELSKDAAAYADESIAAYGAAWDEGVILGRAAPELISELSSKPGAIDNLSLLMDMQAGQFVSAEPSSCGNFSYSATTAAGEIFTASCAAKGMVAKGAADYNVSVVYRAKEWRLLGFFVNITAADQSAATLVSFVEEHDLEPVGIRAAFGGRSIVISPKNRSITYAVLREKAPLIGVHAEAAAPASVE